MPNFAILSRISFLGPLLGMGHLDIEGGALNRDPIARFYTWAQRQADRKIKISLRSRVVGWGHGFIEHGWCMTRHMAHLQGLGYATGQIFSRGCSLPLACSSPQSS